MKSLLLFGATLVLTISVPGVSKGQTVDEYVKPQSPKLSVLSLRVEGAADYAADTRASRTPARATSNPVASDTQGALDHMGDIADQGAGKKYRLALEVRNDDTKAIRAVTFEYVMRRSPSPKSTEAITFKSKKPIKPAETVTLSHSFITREYVSRFGEAIIKRIDYADGSIWRR